MRLRGRLRAVWLGPTEVRIGTDPRWSVVLTDLSPAATRALVETPPGADERTIRAGLARRGAHRAESDAIIDHLRAARLLVDAPAGDDPDAATWALLRADGDGAHVRARRSDALVRVCGLGRTGAAVATTLGASGIGHLELDDASVVSRHDVGCAGLSTRDIGRPRSEAVARAVHDAVPSVRTRPGRRAPDLVVLVDSHVADAVQHRALLAADIPHLSVVVREASALIGPLVRPGRSACLRCAELHRADRDPGWPALAAQLGVARDACPEESALAAVTSALAAAQVMAFLDGRASLVDDGALDVSLPDLAPRSMAIHPHPDCGCCAVPA